MYILITYEGFGPQEIVSFYKTKKEVDDIINFWKKQGNYPNFYLAKVIKYKK